MLQQLDTPGDLVVLNPAALCYILIHFSLISEPGDRLGSVNKLPKIACSTLLPDLESDVDLVSHIVFAQPV